MLFKILFYFIVFYFISRYIRRMFLPSSRRNQAFNPFQGNRRTRQRNFDHIEEADFEDLSDKKESNS